MANRRRSFHGIVLLGLSAVAGCSGPTAGPESTPQSSAPQSPVTSIVLATTTSTRDTGLLDALLPAFAATSGIEVQAVAVGSGQALEIGRRGDAHVLLTHSPAAEEKFMAEGLGDERRSLMYNDFVIVGPGADPARLKEAASAKDAFERVARQKAPFVSRGDESGTHAKERQLWQSAGLRPEGDWYLQAGAGMAEVLRMADQKRAYALTDRGTYLALRRSLELAIAYEGDPALRNRYSVILVKGDDPARREAARRFADFLGAPEGRKIIAEYGVERFGQPLFFLEKADRAGP